MKTNVKILAVNLKKARSRMGLTQLNVADCLKINLRNYQAYEEARADPNTNLLIEICRFFRIADIDSFVTNEDFSFEENDKNIQQSIFEKKFNLLPDNQKRAVKALLELE